MNKRKQVMQTPKNSKRFLKLQEDTEGGGELRAVKVRCVLCRSPE